MRRWQRVATPLVAAGAVFALAFGVGRVVGPVGSEAGGGHAAGGHGADDDRVVLSPAGADGADTDLTLALERPVVAAGAGELAFVVRDADGAPVTEVEVQHEKPLHLVLVRHDLGDYRHLHPALDAATGRWTTPVDLTAGTWRVYADLDPADAAPAVAQADLSVAGTFAPAPPPAQADTTVRVDGYDVHLTRSAGALTFHVTRDGRDVTDLEPHLGAYGHLVAIRTDDLSYLHVHPEPGAAGPELGFGATLTGPARYRLYLEFRHAGRLHRAEFTVLAPAQDDSRTDSHDGGAHDGH